MVSLGPTQAHRYGGFGASASDRESLRSEEVDLLTESEHFSPTVNNVRFSPSGLTWIVAVFESIILVVFEVMIFVLAQGLHINELGGIDAPFSFIALLHVSLWFFVMICHFFLACQHNQMRLRGYLLFYHQTKNLRHIPPLVLSTGNAIFLALFSILEKPWAYTNSFNNYIFLQIVYSLEFIIIFPTLIYYIAKVLSFNKRRPLPDALTFGDDNVRLENQGEIGYCEHSWPTNVLEKQGDLIRFLQQHNENLSRRLLLLSSRAQNQ